jgi:hypothetical protein
VPPDAVESRAERPDVGPRDQARRLSADGPAHGFGRPHGTQHESELHLRFGWIVEAAGKLRATSFVIDGEGVVLGQDDVSDFDQLHSRGHDGAVQPLAFDLQ